MKVLKTSQSLFLAYMAKELPQEKPNQLYEPLRYIMELGGKRIRPLLALWACEASGQESEKALPVALAVEAFHNFSLIHDDIMDDAPLRRGQATVHEKWDANTGILSGDVLLVCAYQYLEAYEGEVFKQLTKTFSETARWVCEGQQMDMNFPKQEIVLLPDYIEMIRKKTAVLLGSSLKMGAIVGGLSLAKSQLFFDFGENLGIAFQLQDDYLDAFGNPETFGKQVGGDIIENKKTYLFLHALEHLQGAQQEALVAYFTSHPKDTAAKVNAVKDLFDQAAAPNAIKAEMEVYLARAFKALKGLHLSEAHEELFTDLAYYLIQRDV
jgi:geranylgeranyl diphosphate synthase type II